MSQVRSRIRSAEKAVAKSVQETKEKLLFLYHELPEWQQDNQFIVGGYVRETLSFKKSWQSLLYLHNETGNIYSHMIPSLVVFFSVIFLIEYILPQYPTTSFYDTTAVWTFSMGIVLCLGTSGLYHLLKSHSHHVSKFGNKLDYIGIVFLIQSSMTSIIYYSMIDRPMLRLFSWTVTGTIGSICVYVSLKEKFSSTDWRTFRATLFVLYGLSGVIPFIGGIYVYGLEQCFSRLQLKWILLEGLFYISGAALYAARIPERFRPGTFDIWGHSHQIFHILVVCGAASHGMGLLQAYHHAHRHVIPLLQGVI
jgi:adiponectin receptor